MSNKIEVSIVQGLYIPNIFKDVPNLLNDVPNFLKDVPNFANDVSNFVKDVPRVPKFISRWRITSNHFPKISKGINGPWVIR